MTTYIWTQTREHAVELFGGETPGSQLEARIIDVFTKQPEHVTRAIEHVGKRYANGKVTSTCWGVLDAQLHDNPAPNATTTGTKEKTKATERAEQWIRTTGIHFDRPEEVEDELFGDRGQLHPWHQDDDLRRQMLNHWHDTRHTGTRLEREAYVRAERWKRTTGAMRQHRRQPSTIPDDLPSVPLDVRLDTEPDPETTE